jgi:hypothetical protein
VPERSSPEQNVARAEAGSHTETASSLCVSIDVEDWYDGMVVLGHDLPRPSGLMSGLGGLTELLETVTPRRACKVTLFVVGNYVERVMPELARLASAGHEIASHGPDHGRVPTVGMSLQEWLVTGREKLEQALQVPVRGFRSPRFDLPTGMSLQAYRDELAEAGFDYVSDTCVLGPQSPVAELPVLRVARLPLGGGSYQRLLPAAAVVRALAPSIASPAGRSVLYYHSYDFGATLPRAGRSAAVAKQVIGRRRIPTILSSVLDRYGSRTCVAAARGASRNGTEHVS